MSSIERLVFRFLTYLPWLCLFLGLIGLILSLLLGQIDLTLRGIILWMPLIMAPVAFVNMRMTRALMYNPRWRIEMPWLLIIFTLSYIFSIALVSVSLSRPPLYYFLVVIMATSIFIQAMTANFGWAKAILIEICLLTVNLVLTNVFIYPFFYGWQDIISHILSIETIVSSGTANLRDPIYIYYPSYHILTSNFALITGVDLKDSVFIVGALISAPTVMGVFLTMRNLSSDLRLALISAFIYSISQYLIAYSSFFVPATLTFPFFVLMIYLLTYKGHIYNVLAIFFMFSIVTTHPLLPFQYSLVMAAISIVWLKRTGSIFIRIWVLMVMTALSYLLFRSGSVFASLTLLVKAFFGERVIFQVQSPTTASAVSYVLSNFAQIPSLFFFLIALFSIPDLQEPKLRYLYMKLTPSLLALSLIYFQNPIHGISQAAIIQLYRWAALAEPFIALTVAAGIYFALKYFKPTFAKFTVVALVGIIAFTSTGNLVAAADSAILGESLYPHHYSASDLASFKFLSENIHDSRVALDLHAYNIFQYNRNYIPITMLKGNLVTDWDLLLYRPLPNQRVPIYIEGNPTVLQQAYINTDEAGLYITHGYSLIYNRVYSDGRATLTHRFKE